ncbi:hypothetical protein JYU34_004400 [Plutella xylostella]|uniref:Uncharacterized protein n=1 Tax=Plutella xylostella TaxID=51655 RepID=A0ABQ7QXV8_PLUXY|nr:hypothetical protein JYU34_004400 [Plutella xylostella]
MIIVNICYFISNSVEISLAALRLSRGAGPACLVAHVAVDAELVAADYNLFAAAT